MADLEDELVASLRARLDGDPVDHARFVGPPVDIRGLIQSVIVQKLPGNAPGTAVERTTTREPGCLSSYSRGPNGSGERRAVRRSQSRSRQIQLSRSPQVGVPPVAERRSQHPR